MAKKVKNIILTKKKTTVEIKDVDNWLFDLRYLVNDKETYSCQIIKTDVPGRIEYVSKRKVLKFNNYESKLLPIRVQKSKQVIFILNQINYILRI